MLTYADVCVVQSVVDQAQVTGESVPERKREGQVVLSGSVVTHILVA